MRFLIGLIFVALFGTYGLHHLGVVSTEGAVAGIENPSSQQADMSMSFTERVVAKAQAREAVRPQ